jgi:hypothetical protein
MSKQFDFQSKPDPVPSQAVGDPLGRLATAALLGAVRDLQEVRPRRYRDAAKWLLTDALVWLDALGLAFNPDDWQDWVLSGCPDRSHKSKRGRRG